jgi:hypothetical protein
VRKFSVRDSRSNAFVRSRNVEPLERRVLLAGAALVADVFPGAAGADPTTLTEANGLLFYTARDENRHHGLRRAGAVVCAVPRLYGFSGFPRAFRSAASMRLARPVDEGGDDPVPPNAAELIPEVVTRTDEQLIVAIELADRREPESNLCARATRPIDTRRSSAPARPNGWRCWSGGGTNGGAGPPSLNIMLDPNHVVVVVSAG